VVVVERESRSGGCCGCRGEGEGSVVVDGCPVRQRNKWGTVVVTVSGLFCSVALGTAEQPVRAVMAGRKGLNRVSCVGV
jgi:hypothetical protein